MPAAAAHRGEQPATTPPPTGARGAAGAPVAVWPVVLVIYAMLLPREMVVELGPVVLFSDRLALLAVLPYLAARLLRGAIRLVLPDALVLIAAGWMILSMMVHYGLVDGLERGGALAFDCTVGYFLARVCLRTPDHLRRVLILAAPGILITGLVIMLESVLHRAIVQPLAEQVFGRAPAYSQGEVAGLAASGSSARFGLLRGKGPFPHAILAGLFLASFVSLYALAGLRGWQRLTGHAAGILSLFTISSTAFVALGLAWLLLLYEWLQARVRELSWRLLALAGAAFALIVTFTTNAGLFGLAGRYLAFDAQTAYFRQLIWRYGMQSVWNHPWFGIGFAGYERPLWMYTESIDAFWLMLAVRHGLPAPLALFSAMVLAILALARASTRLDRRERRLLRGLAIALFVMLTALFSVSIWGNLQSLFNLLLGGGVALAQWQGREGGRLPPPVPG